MKNFPALILITAVLAGCGLSTGKIEQDKRELNKEINNWKYSL